MSETREPMTLADIQAAFDRSPAIATLGLEALSADLDEARIRVRMALKPEMERRAGTGQFHGGPIASFIDTVGDYAIGMVLGGGVPTINIRIDYLKPAFGEALEAEARVRRNGRSVSVVDIDVTDAKGSLVAVGRGTYASTTG